MKQKNFPGLFLSSVLILLLCFSSLSLEGARKGLLLWYQTVLPTLLPFMICINLLVSLEAVGILTAPFCPIFQKFFGLSRSGSFILLCGILCGYPMGAKNCSDFLDQNCISKEEAKCLYAVSSFPSPMFLAGYMMNQANTNGLFVPLWKMAASIYLPAIPLFFLAARIYHFHPLHLSSQLPAAKKKENCRQKSVASPSQPSLPLDEALMSSIEVMVKIGGYIMIFSILSAFIQKLPLPGKILPALLISAAEMTTGIEYASSHLSGLTKAVFICASGTFGGFSGVFQVKSVTKNAGLSSRHYILWKTAHSLSASILLSILLAGFPHS